MLLVRLHRLRAPRQWDESALKTRRLPGALSLFARSCLYPRSPCHRRQPADTIQHSLEQPSRNRHLSQLKDQSPGVPHQTASHLDQLDLHTPQRPVPDRLGQTQPAKEVPKVVRQSDRRPTVQRRWYPRNLPNDCTPTAREETSIGAVRPESPADTHSPSPSVPAHHPTRDRPTVRRPR